MPLQKKLAEYVDNRRQRVNVALDKLLPTTDLVAPKLQQAMHYAVCNGGKRLRPILVYAVGEMLGASTEHLDAPACAIELIHCFSLVHDDLPAMDNDDYRRGQPTCHKAFDEATAILAGDGLQAIAPKLLLDSPVFAAQTRIDMAQCLIERSWDMMLGQAIDLEITHSGKADLASLEKMYLCKTGALISAAMELGAIAANAKTTQILTHLRSLANNIGLAYQIQDDIFDIAESTDATHPKPTYPALTGIDAAMTKVAQLFQAAADNLANLPYDTIMLRAIIEFIMQRGY